MRDEKNDKKGKETDYTRLLNKNDPLDRRILELAEKGKLNVEAVKVHENSESRYPFDGYSRKSLPHRGKHTS